MKENENKMRMFRNYKLIRENPEERALRAEQLMDEWDAKIDAIDAEVRRLVALAERMEERWEEAQERMEEEDWEWVISNLGNPDAMG